MKSQLRWAWLPFVAALCAAASASATPLRPALPSIPYVQISDAAAQAALKAPVCPNGRVCYVPGFIRRAYDFPSGPGAPTGAGQTIVIVTAYGSPSISQDLAQFDAENGIAAPPSFTVVDEQAAPCGCGTNDFLTWAIETSLDVEYAHAMAPGANIVLAVSGSDDSSDFAQTESEVLPQYPSAIVSQSFGADENLFFAFDPGSALTMQNLYAAQIAHGGTVVVASGDLGATDLSIMYGPAPTATFPASSPLVLAVGGTEGKQYPAGLINPAGNYVGEQVWNEVLGPGKAGASGGAPSDIFSAPSWQAGITGSSMRAEPDVAYNAAANGGVVVVLGGHHGVVGGTSAGAPQWAAIVALANELRGRQGKLPLGNAAPALYAIAANQGAYHHDFHDIVQGNNALFGDPSQLPGFLAQPGYDLATGLGTPDVARLLGDLAGGDGSRGANGLVVSRGGKHGHLGLGPGQ